MTSEEALRRIITILELRKWLLENNLRLPTNRLEWKTAAKAKEDFYKSRDLPLPTLTDFNREDLNFADRLISNNLIDKDGVVWFEALKKLYNGRQKDFESFPPEIKLRLEAFTRAIMQEVQEKNLELRTNFIELGLQSGREWFLNKNNIANQEQKFIADKIRNGKM